ncbi:CoxG family protein [Lichenifustis flavocetrariae]|uniref:Carbon monoxide dehydrogenase subunit G n=1 Tax=Lichenifustis flavocetrariae TaxID=2949735 RepID=A0AA42CPU3_9HYPH|nr:carbon monoxide dehydrogenase subunit G [Lichenifustis flavocetrariae]MCW6510760.1 carbon monoxide dehydrogenase subunit G [Lichenifustis flavocetrariae]
MDLNGTQRIEASNETVYAALNDPEVLRQCIPGCESIEKSSDTAMKAKVTLKIGPMKVTFNGNVTLSDLDPPHAYRINGEGSGGVAGFAKGSAGVRLEPEGEGEATLLHYSVKADVGGKIAQLGARLIEGTAKKLSAEFFEKLGTVIVPPAPQVEEVVAEAADAKKPGWFSKTFGTASTS